MNKMIQLVNSKYSTVRNLTTVKPHFQNVLNSKIQPVLFLPPHVKRMAEGGLRLHDSFKSRDVNQKPLITVITVVFNGAETLERAILSVINQSYDNVEFIIIDGGSTDKTLDIIHKYEHAIDYWVSEPDQGIYDAFNKAVTCASGDWIYFLGADDFLWDGAVLANLVPSLLIVNPNLKLAYCRVAIVNSQQELIYIAGEAWHLAKPKLRTVMSVPHQGLLYRRSWFEQYGLFDTSYKIDGDYENFLRGQPHEDAVFIADYIMAGMAQGGISNTPENSIKSYKEVFRLQREHGFKLPNLKLLLAFIRVYIRYGLQIFIGERNAYKLIDLARKLCGMPPYWTKL